MVDDINDIVGQFGLNCVEKEDNKFEIWVSKFQQIQMMQVVYLPLNTLEFNKTGYKQLEMMLSRHHIKNNGYTICCNYDISGYDYWSKQQKESLKIYIEIKFEDQYNKNIFKQDLFDFVNKFYEKYQKLLDCNSYLRRR